MRAVLRRLAVPDVELAGHREAARLEILGLAVEDGDAPGGLLAQPCAALRRIRRAKVLLVQCGRRDLHLPLAERSAEALAGEASPKG